MIGRRLASVLAGSLGLLLAGCNQSGRPTVVEVQQSYGAPPAATAPDPDSTTGDAPRSGIVTTPLLPAATASCATGAGSPGGVRRST